MVVTPVTVVLAIMIVLAFLALCTSDRLPDSPHGARVLPGFLLAGGRQPPVAVVASSLLLIIGTELVSLFVQTAFLNWLPQFLAAVVLVATVPLYVGGGRFNREVLEAKDVRGEHLAARTGAVLLTVAYVALTFWIQSDGFWLTLASAVCLSLAAALALREVLSPSPSLGATVLMLAGALGGATGLYFGATALRGLPSVGIVLLMLGGATLLLAFMFVYGRSALGRGSLVLGGLALLLLSISVLLDGLAHGGAVLLVISVAIIGLGVMLRPNKPLLVATAFLLSSLAMLVGVITNLLRGGLSASPAAWLLWAGACLLVGISILRTRSVRHGVPALNGVSALLLAGASLILGTESLNDQFALFGVIFTVGGVALAAIGTRTLMPIVARQLWWIRLNEYLSASPGKATD
jgi:hypothetical protein